jgi:hypothetical protein
MVNSTFPIYSITYKVSISKSGADVGPERLGPSWLGPEPDASHRLRMTSVVGGVI